MEERELLEPEVNRVLSELFETEKEVVAELWNERMREPILAAFDEKLADALER